ncbi:sensor histidine kinase [Streptomonospora litoralis]|uniref:histidine kinase n=1 Tax=Streptomonospora litoralis TaxID=2498135 RepID=A0A4V0ZK48_9ACTN|nr:sensor histidine kinase [Streptomonospora litoralis]QBI55732.1 Sensor histidine kinase DesK [Streptomonospora litoralis]
MSRQQRTARVLALDIPVALVVGVLTLGAAHTRGGWSAGQPGGPGPGEPPWAAGGPEITLLSPLGYACIAVIAAAVALRRFYPRAAFASALGAVAVFLLTVPQSGMIGLGPMVLTYTLASALPLRKWLGWTALAVPVFLAANADRPYFGLGDPETAAGYVATLSVLITPAAVGVIVRSRRENARREREQELRRSAYEERLRIAREVHDVVGHSLSVINMQAGVALHVLGKRPEQAEPALQAIRQTSKDALEELRGTLAVFRSPDGGGDPAPAGTHAADGAQADASSREPAPGLDRLDELTAGIDSSDRKVAVRIEGEPAALPAAVDHAAYRIVQEALTNAVRHGGGAGATVVIAYQPEELIVEVTDDGPARPGADHREGSGIAGMRERARAVGGRLAAGSRAEGGFRVRAELPVGER